LSWPEGFAVEPPDRDALLVLLHLASVTPARLLELSAEHRTARSCVAAIAGGAAGSEADRSRARTLDSRAAMRKVAAGGARLVSVDDAEYPRALFDLFDPPAGLLLRGRSIAEPGEPAGRGSGARVALVGARNCSAIGGELAGLLGSAVARIGGCVVSGGARGIDEAAHRGALSVAGPVSDPGHDDPAQGDGASRPVTIAVLGCGIDFAYPPRNRRLFDDIARLGAVVSEYPPGTPAEPFRFPARNRIVAALSTAVVVVEGAPNSGSMITVDHAAAIGRDVYAVPGSPVSELAAVPLKLIREGAGLIRSPDDLLGDLGLIPMAADPDGSKPSRPAVLPPPLDATPAERLVWTALAAPAAVDHVAGATGLPIPDAMAALVGLEVRGFIRQAGGRYERTIAPARS
jgi:DNA processing protein